MQPQASCPRTCNSAKGLLWWSECGRGREGQGFGHPECSPRLLEHSSPLLVNYQRGRVEGSRTPCPAENPNESGRAMQLCLQTAGNAKGSLRVGRSVVPCGPVGRPGGHSGWRIPSLSSANYTSKKGVKNAALPPAKKKKEKRIYTQIKCLIV